VALKGRDLALVLGHCHCCLVSGQPGLQGGALLLQVAAGGLLVEQLRDQAVDLSLQRREVTLESGDQRGLVGNLGGYRRQLSLLGGRCAISSRFLLEFELSGKPAI